uniref:Uncharacterized protein n=1 Tax=Pseudomonas phage HRDY3 TaxID=3236930 RepID=A0AB39CDA1_9VIRU
MEDSTILSVEVGSKLHREFAEYCERTGQTMDQAVAEILRDKLNQDTDTSERDPVDPRSLPWQTLIPFARKINKGQKFTVYDLIIRVHSHIGLTTVKVPGAWHSAFAMWVRRHSEFKIERIPEGNAYVRVSDKYAPVPEAKPRTTPLPGVRYTQKELQSQLRILALHQPLNEPFTYSSLLHEIPKEKRPHYTGYSTLPQLKLWANDSRLFKVDTDPRSRNIVTFIRIADAVGEIT